MKSSRVGEVTGGLVSTCTSYSQGRRFRNQSRFIRSCTGYRIGTVTSTTTSQPPLPARRLLPRQSLRPLASFSPGSSSLGLSCFSISQRVMVLPQGFVSLGDSVAVLPGIVLLRYSYSRSLRLRKESSYIRYLGCLSLLSQKCVKQNKLNEPYCSFSI